MPILHPLRITVALLAAMAGIALAQTPEQPQEQPDDDTTSLEFLPKTYRKVNSSVEQGQSPLYDSFQINRGWRLEKRREAFRDTEFRLHLRTYYFNRHKFDGSTSLAWAIGGWAGLKTGYFLDHISLGATVYTSQKLYGPADTDGTLLLAPGQKGYTVLGEAYLDIRIIKGLNLLVGRKEFDSPYINKNDTRMTPNTFEAIVLEGNYEFDEKDESLRYGAGYFDRIKERNSEDFVPMSQDAGASVDRGVYVLGALYKRKGFSIGAIDYFCPDTINIGYAEARAELPIGDWRPKLSLQFTDQRSVGDNALTGESFSVQQFGIKADLPVENALFTAGYTFVTDGLNMQSPWSGYPGYTSVQVQDFNRAGEGAFLLRVAYEFEWIKGLSAYALAVLGTEPSGAGQYRQNEYDVNLQWAPPDGLLKGLSLRVRYAVVHQFGGNVDDLTDFRVICNYAIKF